MTNPEAETASTITAAPTQQLRMNAGTWINGFIFNVARRITIAAHAEAARQIRTPVNESSLQRRTVKNGVAMNDIQACPNP